MSIKTFTMSKNLKNISNTQRFPLQILESYIHVYLRSRYNFSAINVFKKLIIEFQPIY